MYKTETEVYGEKIFASHGCHFVLEYLAKDDCRHKSIRAPINYDRNEHTCKGE